MSAQAESETETETTQQETKSETGSEVETTKEETEVELPADFVVLTKEEISSLPEIDGMDDVASNVLSEIGVAGSLNVTFGNFSNNSGIMITIDAYGETEQGKKLLISFQYITLVSNPEWDIVSVKDADSGHYYYVPETSSGVVDLYDYSTDKLISEKAETPEETTTAESAKSREITELELYGESIIESTEKEMADGYDYISEVGIEVDEPDSIQIIVVVASSTDTDTAKMAGEDVARYLASQASWANSYFKAPGSNDLGSLYDKYDLIVYVKDSSGSISLTGAKARNSSSFVWK